MVVIRQVFDHNGQHQAGPNCEGLRERIQCHKQDRKQKFSCSSTRCARDEDFIERLWETEGSSCVENGLNGGSGQRKRKREYVGPEFIRHDGHFTSVPKAKYMRKDQPAQEPVRTPDPPRNPRCACDFYTTSGFSECGSGYDMGDLCQEVHCGYGCAGGDRGCTMSWHCTGCCTSKREECLDSSIGLLSVPPRKLNGQGNGYHQCPRLATRSASPCHSEESMRSSCDSLSNVGMSHLEELLASPSSLTEPGGELGKLENESRAPRRRGPLRAATEGLDPPPSPGSCGLYNMAHTQPRNSSQKLTTQLESLTLRNARCPNSSNTGAVTAMLRSAHQETLKKARSPRSATQLDNMKASILSHGFYPRLVDAYIKHRKVGATPEMRERLLELQAQMRDWQPSGMDAPDSNQTVNKFHDMLTAYEEELEIAFQKSMKFCDCLEKDLEYIAMRVPVPCRSVRDTERKVPIKKPAWR